MNRHINQAPKKDRRRITLSPETNIKEYEMNTTDRGEKYGNSSWSSYDSNYTYGGTYYVWCEREG